MQRGGQDIIKRFEGVEPTASGLSGDGTRCRKQAFDEFRPFRVASISKLAVAETARSLARSGKLSLDADISGPLGMEFRNPGFPDVKITMSMLLSHTSGVVDPPAYWVAAPGDIRSLLGPTLFDAGVLPGAYFRYANLNYGIAATVMEAATRERFDRLASRLALRPAGVQDAAFNWSGRTDRAVRGAALWRGSGSGRGRGEGQDEDVAWNAQLDSVKDRSRIAATGEPAILHEDGLDLDTYLDSYVPGTNGTLFSPQGGLRASFSELMQMGRAWLSEPEPVVLWDAAGQSGNVAENMAGDTADDHFVQFGLGRYIYPPDRSPIPGVRVVGHVGEAYGFYGGLWAAPARDAVWAFGTLGSARGGMPMTGGSPNLRVGNQAFMAEVAVALTGV